MKRKSLSENIRLVLTFAWLIYGFVVLHLASILKIINLILRVIGIEL